MKQGYETRWWSKVKMMKKEVEAKLRWWSKMMQMVKQRDEWRWWDKMVKQDGETKWCRWWSNVINEDDETWWWSNMVKQNDSARWWLWNKMMGLVFVSAKQGDYFPGIFRNCCLAFQVNLMWQVTVFAVIIPAWLCCISNVSHCSITHQSR